MESYNNSRGIMPWHYGEPKRFIANKAEIIDLVLSKKTSNRICNIKIFRIQFGAANKPLLGNKHIRKFSKPK